MNKIKLVNWYLQYEIIKDYIAELVICVLVEGIISS